MHRPEAKGVSGAVLLGAAMQGRTARSQASTPGKGYPNFPQHTMANFPQSIELGPTAHFRLDCLSFILPLPSLHLELFNLELPNFRVPRPGLAGNSEKAPLWYSREPHVTITYHAMHYL